MKTLLLVAVALAGTMFLSSCPSLKTDVAQPAMFAAARASWPDIKQDLTIGIEVSLSSKAIDLVEYKLTLENVHTIGGALKSSSIVQLKSVSWDDLIPYVELGITSEMDKGAIGPGVAQSLLEHLNNFTETINKLRLYSESTVKRIRIDYRGSGHGYWSRSWDREGKDFLVHERTGPSPIHYRWATRVLSGS